MHLLFAAIPLLSFTAPQDPISERIVQVAGNTPGARLLWGDFDGDGRLDGYSIGGGRSDALLRNEGGGSFADLTAGVGLAGHVSRNAIVEDFDGDGRCDLLLLSVSGRVTLLHSASAGMFVESGPLPGLDPQAEIVQVQGVDFDRDGWVDLQLEARDQTTLLRNVEGEFEPIALPQGAPLGANSSVPSAAPAARPVRADDEGPGVAGESTDGGGSTSRRRLTTTDEGASSGRGPRVALNPGARPSSVDGTGGSEVSGLMAAAPFARAIQDKADPGTSLSASSTPTLGRLYPLSQDLFVDPLGRVGLGTTTPGSKLDVNGTAQISKLVAGTANLGSPTSKLSWTVRGESGDGPTNGYLGVRGATAFDGVSNLNLPGWEVGVLGVSAGPGATDNYGVLGHGGQAGVRGENAATPTDFAELGRPGVGLYAQGSTHAGDFVGDVRVQSDLQVIGATQVNDVTSSGSATFGNSLTAGPFMILGESNNGPTRGYLGVQGTAGFDGLANLNMPGWEVGVLGVSSGVSQTDNFGVVGHGGKAGVRGENATTPFDFAELGRPGVGVYARGSTYAGDFVGDVRIQGEVNQPETGSNHMLPIAWGTVNAAGYLYNHSGNVTLTSPGLVKPYRLAIANEFYNDNVYATSVSPISTAESVSAGANSRTATFYGTGGELVVFIWNSRTGDLVLGDFSFIVYRPQ